MILGLGVDLVDVRRIQKALDRWQDKFPAKVLAPEELKFFGARSAEPALLAKQFAAKEAVAKALGTGLKGVALRDIHVLRRKGGMPVVHLHGRAKARASRLGIAEILVSTSDEQRYAIAYAIAYAVAQKPSP
ncbi:MAG: holo-ACP synthase [Pseudomonadales bacterium]